MSLLLLLLLLLLIILIDRLEVMILLVMFWRVSVAPVVSMLALSLEHSALEPSTFTSKLQPENFMSCVP